QKLFHLLPELAERFLLGSGQLGQRALVAEAGEVGVALPMPEGFRNLGAGLQRTGRQFLGKECEVGLEPGEGLFAPVPPGLVVELGSFLAPAAAGRSRRAGSVVAVALLAVFR